MYDHHTYWYKGTEFPTIDGVMCWSGVVELSYFTFEKSFSKYDAMYQNLKTMPYVSIGFIP
jgi:hypothetical protein